MLKRLLLQGLFVDHNPVFDLELRRIARTRRVLDLRRQFWRSMRTVYIVAGVVGMLVFLLYYTDYSNSYSEYYWRWLFLNLSGTMFMLGSSLGILITLICDMYYVFTTVGLISEPILLGQWESLRLTRLRESDIIAGKYAATLVKSWRTTAFEAAWRIASFSFLVVPPILAVLDIGDWYADMTSDGWMALGIMIVTGLLVAVSVILESVWRVRAFVALGLWISSAIHSSSMAVLAGIGAILAVRLAQITLIVVITFSAVMMWRVTGRYDYYSNPATPAMLYILAYCVVIAATIFVTYKGLQTLALHRVVERAFRSE